jgi:hypothetical protein
LLAVIREAPDFRVRSSQDSRPVGRDHRSKPGLARLLGARVDKFEVFQTAGQDQWQKRGAEIQSGRDTIRMVSGLGIDQIFTYDFRGIRAPFGNQEVIRRPAHQ